METLSATTIFWLIVMGATIGWVHGYLIGHEGITLISNIIWGIAGSVASGVVALIIGVSGVFLFGLMYTLAALFIANVFHLHHVEDITGDIDRGMRIKRKKKAN